MKTLRLASAIALAAIGSLLATAVPAHAASASFPFRADSGDNCRYGSTQGTLIWQYSTTTPILPISVDIRGNVVDHPIPNENFLCVNDGFYSVASYTAFAGSISLREEVRADNAIVPVSLTLGPTSPTAAGITRVTIQVCRHPLFGTRPSYCGMPQSYAPVVFDPPLPSS
jgi:hypothetical protein